MKLAYKIALIAVAGVLLISVLLSLAIGMRDIFLVVLGAVSSIVATLALVLGFIMHLVNSKEFSKAFFLTAGILFLMGVGICGPMFMGIWPV